MILALSSTNQTQPQPRDAFKIAIATEHHSVLAQLQATGRLKATANRCERKAIKALQT